MHYRLKIWLVRYWPGVGLVYVWKGAPMVSYAKTPDGWRVTPRVAAILATLRAKYPDWTTSGELWHTTGWLPSETRRDLARLVKLGLVTVRKSETQIRVDGSTLYEYLLTEAFNTWADREGGKPFARLPFGIDLWWERLTRPKK
jgi:hypothetical protein